MKKSTIIYSRGGQFKGGKSIFLFFVSLSLLIRVIYLVFHSEYASMLLTLVFLALTLFIMTDIRGVEIDIKKNKIREYRLRIWGKTGAWMDYQQFSKITLSLGSYDIHTSDLSPEGNGSYSEKHHHFVVELVNTHGDKKLTLGEKSDYKEARQLMKEASIELNLETQNKFQERLRISKQRRR